jgi:hypothetical protein
VRPPAWIPACLYGYLVGSAQWDPYEPFRHRRDMHGHAKIPRAVAIIIAVAVLVVAGRLIASGLDAPGRQGTTGAAGTPTSSAARTTLIVTRAAQAGWVNYLHPVDRLSVTIPSAWSAKADPIPQFTSPDPILAVGSWSFPDDPTASCAPTRTVPADGALLWVQESRPGDGGNFDPEEFPPRPRSFGLRTMSPTTAECTEYPSYAVQFREAGRYFWVTVVLGPEAPAARRAVVEQVLQSLRPTS